MLGEEMLYFNQAKGATAAVYAFDFTTDKYSS
jgi:hypothetical protein